MKRSMGPTIVLIMGLLLLLYPVGASLFNDLQLSRQAAVYSGMVREHANAGQLTELVARARTYNAELLRRGPHARRPVDSDPEMAAYREQLNIPALQGVMARISIPSIKVDLPVFHTTAAAVLYQGAGHMFGSSLPVGGLGNNTVISAHTGMVNASMFDDLPLLHDGADVYLDVLGQTLRYRVTGRQVVGPADYQAVTYEPTKDKLTLVTCTPYGLNTDRLLVFAERVPVSAGEPVPPLQRGAGLAWWMWIDLAVVLFIAFLAWYRQRRRSRRQRQRQSELARSGVNSGI